MFFCSIPSGLWFTHSKYRRFAPTAIIVQSAYGLEEPEHHPAKGETIIAVCGTYGKKTSEAWNPFRVQHDFPYFTNIYKVPNSMDLK